MSRKYEEMLEEDETDPRAPARGCLLGLLITIAAVLLVLAAWRFWPA